MEFSPPSSGRFTNAKKLTHAQKRKIQEQNKIADKMRKDSLLLEEKERQQLEDNIGEMLDDVY